MKRVHEENLNTPERFNYLWTLMHQHRWDTGKAKALVEHVQSGQTVVEIGGGIYGACEFLAQKMYKGQLIVIDFSEQAKRHVQAQYPQIAWLTADITQKQPLPANVADVMIASEVIEHMEDPQAFVARLAAMTKPGGWMMISTVDTHCEQAKVMDYPEHLWEFEPEELRGFFNPFGWPRYYLVGNYHFIACRKGKFYE